MTTSGSGRIKGAQGDKVPPGAKFDRRAGRGYHWEWHLDEEVVRMVREIEMRVWVYSLMVGLGGALSSTHFAG